MDGSSGENLEFDSFLKLTGVFDQLDDFLFSLIMSVDLGDVLAEDVGTPISENGPKVLDEGFAEENEPLLATVLEVDVEVVLLHALAVGLELLLNIGKELAVSRDLARLDEDVECHLGAFFLQDVFWNFQNFAEQISKLSDAFRFIDLISQLVHDTDLDKLAELADDGLPERVHLDSLLVDRQSLNSLAISVFQNFVSVNFHIWWLLTVCVLNERLRFKCGVCEEVRSRSGRRG